MKFVDELIKGVFIETVWKWLLLLIMVILYDVYLSSDFFLSFFILPCGLVTIFSYFYYKKKLNVKSLFLTAIFWVIVLFIMLVYNPLEIYLLFFSNPFLIILYLLCTITLFTTYYKVVNLKPIDNQDTAVYYDLLNTKYEKEKNFKNSSYINSVIVMNFLFMLVFLWLLYFEFSNSLGGVVLILIYNIVSLPLCLSYLNFLRVLRKKSSSGINFISISWVIILLAFLVLHSTEKYNITSIILLVCIIFSIIYNFAAHVDQATKLDKLHENLKDIDDKIYLLEKGYKKIEKKKIRNVGTDNSVNSPYYIDNGIYKKSDKQDKNESSELKPIILSESKEKTEDNIDKN